ncbi:hypothetical protein FB451DRAFT_1339694 [Mycena latifolia]|nr:hypothetical protein FB451DRAFT_1339694 [Mycena latifolia]
MFTPRKHMRLLGIGLASTSSGSFLVSKPKATHLDFGKLKAPVFERVPDHLRQPDWGVLQRTASLPDYTRDRLETRCQGLERELADARRLLHAHEVISEGQNAQLIVQNMAMGKMSRALFEKEKGKKSDRSVIAQKRELENAKERETTDKAAKKARRDAKKVEREQIEVAWKEICVAHDAAVEKWAGRCLELKVGGVWAKDLPKKPKRPPKPKPKESDDEGDDSGGREGSDDDG